MKSSLILILLLISISAFTQEGGVWTWMNGSESSDPMPIYGNKGEFAPEFQPAGRYQSAHWQDSTGNFWIFGGTQGSYGYNDLWTYNPKINEWAWVSGSPDSYGLGYYGEMGIPGPNVTPPNIGFGALRWYDGGTKLYLYGGRGSPIWNRTDLWSFDIETFEWVWLWGEGPDEFGETNYDTLGATSADNHPGRRLENESSWYDDGKLWFFGGQMYDGNSAIGSSDVWYFDLDSMQWAWQKGPMFEVEESNFGIQGIPDEENYPSGRLSYSSYYYQDTVYIFGGHLPFDYIGDANLWSYVPENNVWTWIHGDTFSEPIYEAYCAIDIENNTGGTHEYSAVHSSLGCSEFFWKFG